MLKPWYLRLLEEGLVRQPEGAGGAGVAGTGGGGGGNGAVREDDDDDEGDPDNEPPAADVGKELAQWRKYAKRLRTENANRRAEAKDLKGKLAAKDGELADLKKAHKEALDKKDTDHKTEKEALVSAEKKAGEQRLITGELRALAIKEGAKDVDDLLKIIDASAITIDDKGVVVGADKLIADTKKAKPHLFGQASSASSSSATKPEPEKGEAKDALKMTDEEYAAAKSTMTGVPQLRRRA